MRDVPREIERTVRTLARTAEELRRGKYFPISRLTTVKNLCRDQDAAAKFARQIAKLAMEKMDARRCPANMRLARWTAYNRLAVEAVESIAQFVKRRTRAKEHYLRRLLILARDAQDTYERRRWGMVRIIDCWDLLVVETAMECVLHPWASADLGFQLARQYAEQYDPHFGMGLVPDSAPMMEEIADFWGQYYLGRGWRTGIH
jgi:hypothetical protein